MPVRRDAEAVLEKECKNPEDLWDIIVDIVNWNRVLLEAQGRHLELHFDNSDRDMDRYICGECLAEALKVDSTFPSWETTE